MALPRGAMRLFVIVVFPDHTHYFWQIHERKDVSKPSNIHHMINFFTVLHIVAKQPINIAKKH